MALTEILLQEEYTIYAYSNRVKQVERGTGEVGKPIVKIIIYIVEETATQNQPEKYPHSAPPYHVLEEIQGDRRHSTGILLNF